MNQNEIRQLLDVVEKKIQTTVNGKIDKMNEKLDKHVTEHEQLMDKLDPIVDAVQWINTTKNYVMWISGLIAAVGSAIAVFKGLK